MFLNGPSSLAALAVTGTAQAITATDDAQFRAFTISPTNGNIYWGGPGVTTTTGQPLNSGQSLTIATKDARGYFVVAASGTVDVRLTLYRGVG